ncbi:uncharacterized protein [Diabrotica undecimpunctata]|uniref:uncharacterized protein n=1 Tax=Diabrotica undecimpunctata TaxID=50387 RepID=UPI003B638BA2
MCQVYVASAILILALVDCGLALQCWSCKSEFDVTCRDYFNVTKIEENRRHFENFNFQGNNRPFSIGNRNEPHEVHCDGSYVNNYNQKTVCIKTVFRGYTSSGSNSDIPNVHRDCRIVPKSLPVGECPDELKNDKSRNIDYCVTCETDGCNLATGIKSNLILASIPLVLLVLLQK